MGPLGDSVMVSDPQPPAPNLLVTGGVTAEGSARFDTVTVGEAGVLRAENAQQLAAAERLVRAGVYLGDPYRLIVLQPAGGDDAIVSVVRQIPVGSPLTTELLVRRRGPGPLPVLRFEHGAGTDGGEGGRRMPSAIAFELTPSADGRSYSEARLLIGGGDEWSEQEDEDIPDVDWEAYAHRIGIVIAPDVVSLAVDGNAVIEERVRLHGPATSPLLRAVGAAGAGALVVLEWTGVVE